MAALSPRLRARLAAEGFPVRCAEPLSSRHASVWILELSDGRRVKLRQLKSAAAAAEVWRLLVHRRTSVLPRPLLRTTRNLLLEYVDGVRLDRHLAGAGRTEERRQIRRAGGILAELHRGTAPAGYVRNLSEYRRLLTRMLRRLARTQMLDGDVAARLERIEPPGRVRFARTHGDLQPENLIVSGAHLRAIDVERLATRPAVFDLARTVQLWPLAAKQEHELVDAYAAAGGRPAGYLSHRSFWLAAALSTSVAFRLHFTPDGVPPLVASLRELADALE